MEVRILIDDGVMGRIPWSEMKALIEDEFDRCEERTVSQVRSGYKALGLEVKENEVLESPREPSPGN